MYLVTNLYLHISFYVVYLKGGFRPLSDFPLLPDKGSSNTRQVFKTQSVPRHKLHFEILAELALSKDCQFQLIRDKVEC